MKIVIVGGSAAGAFAALLVARAGHEALVLEQDQLRPAQDVEAAAETAFRPAAPQIVQPHVVLARSRELLRERLPDIYDALLAAGAAEADVRKQMPASLADTADWPGDERLTMLMSRRSTIDWVLQRALGSEPGVTTRFGIRVLGLRADPAQLPLVTGVRTDHGEVVSDLVVDATGRRSPIDRWLSGIGARPTSVCQAECGLAYFSRHYRVRSGAQLPGPATSRIVVPLDEFLVGLWGGDNGTMQLAVAPLAADRRFRTIKDADVFTAVVRTVPLFAAWLDGLDPVSEVFPMGGLHNTMRRLVVGGEPVATGLHAVGDSVCTTNPTFGRGLCMSLVNAIDLLDTIGEHEGDLLAQAHVLDRLADDHITPFYADQAATDGARLAMLRHVIFGAPAPDPQPPGHDRVTFAQLRSAASFDPAAFRGFWRIMGMISKPDEVYTDPDVVAGTRRGLRNHGRGLPLAHPTRDQLLAALAGA